MSKAEDLKKSRVGKLFSLERHKFIRFKGAALYNGPGTRGFERLSAEAFTPLAHDALGIGLSKGTIADLFFTIAAMAPDWTDKDHLIAFHDQVWDMRRLAFVEGEFEYVYSSHIRIDSSPAAVGKVRRYLLELADGDEELAQDYIQVLAPLFMYRKPMGIIWLLGQGANGKSAFLDALYEILGKHFADQSMDMLEDGRSAPSLRGILGNIVREASEKRIEDDKHYKNIGAHESFPIRVLGTHDVVTVDANFHTIMNANNAPVFEDKSMGSRRRTLLVPFPATFPDDPGFKERTFTPDFLGALLHLALEATRDIRDHGYQWSPQTAALQEYYNENANTAESYGRYLDEIGLVAFNNYRMLHTNYQNWCTNNGRIALGMTQLARAMENILKVPQKSQIFAFDEKRMRCYPRPGIAADDITWLDNGYGMGKPKEGVLQPEVDRGW